MKLGVIQSNYLPWRGYFDFINSVDLFVFHDDLQYTKGDWRNRNKLKTPSGLRWLTVPVHYERTNQLICETEIDYSKMWQRDHLNLLRANYSKAPFFSDAADILSSAFHFKDRTISELNVRLIRAVCAYLRITTRVALSADFALEGAKTDRLVQLAVRTGASCYLSGPSGRDYLQEDQFSASGIDVEYKRYNYPEYPQQWGEFVGNVTILDLISNCGPDSSCYIQSAEQTSQSAV